MKEVLCNAAIALALAGPGFLAAFVVCPIDFALNTGLVCALSAFPLVKVKKRPENDVLNQGLRVET